MHKVAEKTQFTHARLPDRTMVSQISLVRRPNLSPVPPSSRCGMT